ncbi:MAG: hypothetical protein R8N50_01935 [Alphaproteobacteria bacterium]|nr:hypothetical protein [Alphaproteobacteria bacterium]
MFAVLLVIFSMPSMASDCMEYKKIPAIYINTPDWSKKIVQPRQPMNLLHGNVVATLIDNYQINVNVNSTEDGLCIGLKSVDAVVGYSDFIVSIDKRHTPGTCTYKAVLSHEDKHIKTYLSVIDDFKADLLNSIYNAAQSVMPRFVKSYKDIDAVIVQMNNELQNHPEVVLVKQKIHAAQEIRNKQIDADENNKEIKKCE